MCADAASSGRSMDDDDDVLLVSVAALALFCDPFRLVCWHMDLVAPITREEVAAYVEDPALPVDGARQGHAAGIARYVRDGWTRPLDVDVGVPSLGWNPPWIVDDGNHRLAAAIYLGMDTVEISLGGSMQRAVDMGLVTQEQVGCT